MNMNLENIRKTQILVCGDGMLDQYWHGDAERLSPEAPVPVVKVARKETRLGGSANVALNIASLRARSILLTVVGTDDDSLIFENLLRQAGVEPALVRDVESPTIVKLRVIARNQQMLRCDFEQPIGPSAQEKLKSSFLRYLDDANAVILSDYHKGTLAMSADLIKEAKNRLKPVFVDPKGSDWSRYRGATVVTPNKAEFRQVVGQWHSESELFRLAQEVRKEFEIDNLLLTRSEEGMSLFSDMGQKDFPTQAREVFDVSGAGDTVIAVLTTLYSSGVDLLESVRLANAAAGIVVSKFGTVAVQFDELFGE